MRGAFRVICTAVVLCGTTAIAMPQSAALKIVVIAGEDGVNIVGKGTAVAPVVEVRDQNDLPVAGASVVFLLGGNGARFANNATSLTVATDGGGRATATGLQAVGKGAVRIQVQATYQGETATASVTHTNFASVAEAAKAGKSVTNVQGSGNSASQGGSQAAAQGSHHIGLIAAGAGAVAGGVVAKNKLGDGAGAACLSESIVSDNSVQAFLAAARVYSDCMRRASAAACAAQQSAATTAGQQFVQANNVYCACNGSTPTYTSADAAAYMQDLVAGGASISTFNCR